MIVKNVSKSSIKILSYINDGKTNYKHMIVKNVSKTSIMIIYLIKNDYKTKFCAHSCEEYSVIRYMYFFLNLQLRLKQDLLGHDLFVFVRSTKRLLYFLHLQ